MAYQDFVVVALVFMAVVGVFAIDSSTSPAPSKASSPSKPLSSSSPASSPKIFSIKSLSQSSNSPSLSPSKSDEIAPKSSHSAAPKSSSSSYSPSLSKSGNPKAKKGFNRDVESPEMVSSPPSPTINDEVSDAPSSSPKGAGDVADNDSLKSTNDSPAPTPSDAIVIKVATLIFSVITIFGFYLL
ncbi:hypothetical protein ES332_A02G191500v1 [Gossypium tomentosum]|uniref:REJ domain-containing protein n=1 Tax=Gossypium tomentosum TaxID=34277 RepID=A0A5D2RJ25_GOSTO|nr:hypothetical protein ES332_A02G191500v1 [Gossypium tomentosum]